MKLHTRTWGDGGKTAVLVHGIMSDSRTWHRVAPRLADLGYRVVAVDLRGHGASPRGAYSPQEWADDLVDTLDGPIAVAIGHSLGAVALSLAVDRLDCVRAIYSDPAFLIGQLGTAADREAFRRFKHATREQIVAVSPRWDTADVDVELATLADWDDTTVDALAGIVAVAAPASPRIPSLVQLAELSFGNVPEVIEKMREDGLEVRIVPGAGHTIHRDDLDGFFTTLDGWI
ncbi:alpha/beta fold hydrolase [Actinoplanes aureus]|uniref:Alpha/beta hydrolase n=1 Tax=Actinoplanes aureus TaxID=2792083 RepID=A0A931CBN0_9ACTN|nr:alpha/beta hydrolase [Actinoplanes aureus]MBG0564158.1 alpha/beta hydrolase [Actinoplanes aureus]